MSQETTVQTISVHELMHRYQQDPNLCLIDVRELDEWTEQHIPWARHIPKDQIMTAITNEIPERTKTIYLHCRSGVRSLYAAEYLISLGYESIISVTGGISAWHQAGYPVSSHQTSPNTP